MTKQEEKNAVAVMLEWVTAEKPLEFRRRDGSGNWFECTKPCWNWSDFEFRIKPEPREFYVSVDQNGRSMRVFDTPAAADGLKWVKVREVLE